MPRTSGLLKKVIYIRKSSAPGSEAAQDKWLLQKKVGFLRTSSAPGYEAALDKRLLQKRIDFLVRVLPQAAKLPGTSGSFKDKWLVQKQSDF